MLTVSLVLEDGQTREKGGTERRTVAVGPCSKMKYPFWTIDKL